MAGISGAGTPIDIKLGQVPTTKNPQLAYELQGIYNSLHILSQYLEVLRAGLEGSDDQTPAENIRFLKFLNGKAGQKITAGHIVSFDTSTGKVIKGFNFGAYRIDIFLDQNENYTAYLNGMLPTFFGVAQNDAEIDEDVSIGIGPGILKVTGATSGTLVYAFCNKGITFQGRGELDPIVFGFENSGLGDIYLAYPGVKNLPGYPRDISDTVRITGATFSSPIGIGVAKDYVLFSDFIYWTGFKVNSIFDIYPGLEF